MAEEVTKINGVELKEESFPSVTAVRQVVYLKSLFNAASKDDEEVIIEIIRQVKPIAYSKVRIDDVNDNSPQLVKVSGNEQKSINNIVKLSKYLSEEKDSLRGKFFTACLLADAVAMSVDIEGEDSVSCATKSYNLYKGIVKTLSDKPKQKLTSLETNIFSVARDQVEGGFVYQLYNAVVQDKLAQEDDELNKLSQMGFNVQKSKTPSNN